MPAKASQIVAEIRSFNRFYTREIGVLRESFLDAGLSLPEARVLYEIFHGAGLSARAIGQQLRMDAGYLSRVLQKLERRRLITRKRSASDGRQSVLALTRRGREQFEIQNRRQNEEVEKMLAALPVEDQQRLVAAMKSIQSVLGGEVHRSKPFMLRPPRLGDMGWIVFRHGEGYATLHGWSEQFEALVARIVSDFETAHDAEKERCWIAERDGERMGCVFLVKHPEQEEAAKLRLLWVEPAARGLGLGKALVQECTRFARQVGYKRIVLWTNSELKAARGIYEQEGYKLLKREPHPVFAKGQFGEEWELSL
jgi:DNA-binding MarR family transcriptional regulator/GNAT superfamily N-acetyltransferase